jgi:hypothetical protein
MSPELQRKVASLERHVGELNKQLDLTNIIFHPARLRAAVAMLLVEQVARTIALEIPSDADRLLADLEHSARDELDILRKRARKRGGE